MKRSAAFVATLWLLGYSSLAGAACVGAVLQPPEGLKAVADDQLLASAIGEVGEGKLCEGRVYEVTTPGVRVFRVWTAAKDYTAYGRWWSFDIPQGPKRKYRKANVICPSWSELDRMSSCDVKVGTRVVVGPGQSATCKRKTLPQSAVNQVYIPNDSRNDQIHVENCTDGEDWPGRFD